MAKRKSNLMAKHGDEKHAKLLDAGKILIVGDGFSAFSEYFPWILTFTQFQARKEQLQKLCIPITLGQGLHDAQRNSVNNWRQNLCQDGALLPKRESKRNTHKHEAKNILVSKFRRDSEDQFTANLLVDDRNEMITDHNSTHVSGMLISECFRQAFLAVTELFYLPSGDGNQRVFVTQEFNCAYKAFVFALPALIKYKMIKADISNPARRKFRAEIDLIQSNIICSSATVSYLVMPKKELLEIEKNRALECFRTYNKK